MNILKAIKHLILGSTVLGWVKNEVDKGLASAADKVAVKYGAEAKQFVIDAESALDGASNPITDSAKLFKVGADVIALAAKDGWTVPFLVAVLVAQRTYAQVKADALAEVNGFLAGVKALGE